MYKDFRAILRRAAEDDLVKDEPVALLFSGGTDSLTVLWALLDLKADVRCYCFHLERNVSEDAKKAELASKIYRVPLTTIVIPSRNNDEIRGELTGLIRWMGTARKTHIECTWPFTYVAPEILERQVWCGLNADDLWGSARNTIFKFSKKPIAFRESREQLILNPKTSAWRFIKELFERDYGKELISLYRSWDVINYLLGYDWAQLNKPWQKMPALEAFKPEWDQVPEDEKLWRLNDNLQCGSGIREYLAQPAIAEGYSDNQIGYYKMLLQEVKDEQAKESGTYAKQLSF